MGWIRESIKKYIYKEKYSSETYINYLRRLGMTIGDGVTIFDPFNVFIDPSRPYLIKIGNNVQITRGVTILTHGFDWSVIKGKYGDILGSSGGVEIGDNVFIGMNSIVLKGCHIGNNVIIGAGSVITHSIKSDSVVAGNPARVLMSLDDYYQKRKLAQEEEAKELVQQFRIITGKEPSERELHEFFFLFTDNADNLNPLYNSMLNICGNRSHSIDILQSRKAKYKSFNDFLMSINDTQGDE